MHFDAGVWAWEVGADFFAEALLDVGIFGT